MNAIKALYRASNSVQAPELNWQLHPCCCLTS